MTVKEELLNAKKYIESLKKDNSKLNNENEKLRIKLEELTEALLLMRFKQFGKSSEKLDVGQLDFFEALGLTLDENLEDEEEVEDTLPESKSRKKSGRKPINPLLDREEIIHDIPEEDKTCGCGCSLTKVGEEVSERLNIIPEKIYVEKHIRPKYACKNCEGSGDEENPVFRIAPAEPSLVPGSIMTPGLLAFILVAKFCDHLPFNRQQNKFERIGVSLDRKNMSNWTIKAYKALYKLDEILKTHIRSGPYLQMDETPMQVMNEEDKSNTSKSYMWLSKGGPIDKPAIIYDYNISRSADYLRSYLEGFSGFLQTDGYVGYDSVVKGRKDIIHVGCLAHCRRMFHDALKVEKKTPSSNVPINQIAKIYAIEKKLREKNLPEDVFLAERKALVTPVAEDLKDWLVKRSTNTRPSAKLGKAITYTLKQWDKVFRYLDCPYLTPDNNASERSIKPFVVGRKNWLFSGNPNGAKAMCFFFSLIETAKVNKLEPYSYLTKVFTLAPLIKEDEIESLLPWNIK